MKKCDCKETCSRHGVFADGSGGFWCPYIPGFITPNASLCRKALGEVDLPAHIIPKDNTQIEQ